MPFIDDAKSHNLAVGDRVRWVAADMYVGSKLVIRKGGVTEVTGLQEDNRIFLGGGAIEGLFGATDAENVERFKKERPLNMKRVEIWEASDGTRFESDIEATRHEVKLKRTDLLMGVLEGLGYSPQSNISMEDLAGELVDVRAELLEALK